MSVWDVVSMIGYGATVGVALAAPIGPINIEIIRRGLRDGTVHGWVLGLGALSADTIYAFVIVLGWAAFADRPEVRIALYLAGGLMLAWVGVQAIRASREHVELGQTGSSRSLVGEYTAGFLMAALNPMGIVYWLTVGAGLAADAVRRIGQHGAPILVAGVMTGILAWVSFLSVIAHVSRRFVTGVAMRTITFLGGVLVACFGVWFLLQGVTTWANRF